MKMNIYNILEIDVVTRTSPHTPIDTLPAAYLFSLLSTCTTNVPIGSVGRALHFTSEGRRVQFLVGLQLAYPHFN